MTLVLALSDTVRGAKESSNLAIRLRQREWLFRKPMLMHFNFNILLSPLSEGFEPHGNNQTTGTELDDMLAAERVTSDPEYGGILHEIAAVLEGNLPIS
jgi:hypothetical protein